MPIGLMRDILPSKPSGRLICFDHGERRIGVAISDPMQSIATAITVIDNTKFSKYITEIKQIYSDYDIAGFVVGLPLNMDGSEGPRCNSVRDFSANLRQTGFFGSDPWIALFDERLSSSAVEDFLIDEADMNRKRRSEVIDKLAAQHILQAALNTL